MTPNGPTQLLVAHPDGETRAALKDIPEDCTVIGEASSHAELEAVLTELEPEVMLVADEFPDGSGIDAAIRAANELELPSVIIANRERAGKLERVIGHRLIGHVFDPLTSDDARTLLREQIMGAISQLVARLETIEKLSNRVAALRDTMDERKIIERAKGVLMSHHRLGEDDAHHLLQRRATRSRTKLVETAVRIVAQSERIADGTHAGADGRPVGESDDRVAGRSNGHPAATAKKAD